LANNVALAGADRTPTPISRVRSECWQHDVHDPILRPKVQSQWPITMSKMR
jgi:hypothetical protein